MCDFSYLAERMQSLGYDWHPECLRCEECSKRLNPGQHAEVWRRTKKIILQLLSVNMLISIYCYELFISIKVSLTVMCLVMVCYSDLNYMAMVPEWSLIPVLVESKTNIRSGQMLKGQIIINLYVLIIDNCNNLILIAF